MYHGTRVDCAVPDLGNGHGGMVERGKAVREHPLSGMNNRLVW